MNKKNLSVVMAGAMLATSVAPVLAAETTTQKDYTVNNSNKGLLIRELRELIESKSFSNIKENKDYVGKSVHYVKANSAIVVETKTATSAQSTDVKNELKEKYGIKGDVSSANPDDLFTIEQSVSGSTYTFTIKTKPGFTFDESNISLMETAIQNASAGTKFEVWDRGFEEKDGYVHAYSTKDVVTPAKFTAAELELLANTWEANGKIEFDKNENGIIEASNSEGTQGTNSKNIQDAFPAVYKMEYSKDSQTLTVKTRVATGESEDTRFVTEYKVGDTKVDFTKPVDKNDKVLDGDYSTIDTEDPFAMYTLTANNVSDEHTITKPSNTATVVKQNTDIPEKKLYTITISDVDYDYTTTLSNLYDGLFLTENGQKLLDTMEEYDANESKGWSVSGEGTINTEASGIYSMVITFTKPLANNNKEIQNVKITTNDKAKLEIFRDGIAPRTSITNYGTLKHRNFPVEVLAGNNRYETAVKVAKENADIRTVAENGNIVLVNGNSLVDGLAAAPLAATVQNKDNNSGNPTGNIAAPILLTDSNGIPKATKDYMKEIVGQQKIMNLDKVTVYIVGGESVISKAVENDLKEIGFRVVRAGGNDREATSLAVAELMKKDNVNVNDEEAFLVGAYGEADAMSIAGKAAETGTPIIVESVHGITDDTINYLKGYKNDTSSLEGKDVTIIGGEVAVSEATEAKLVDEKLEVQRVAGSNRQATNAKVMNMFYKNGTAERFIVSKDGVHDKTHLIDALTATSLAAKHHAPIVLATDKLSNDQINTMELKSVNKGVYVYQVGLGVQRDVVKTIADRVGLAK